MGEGLVSFEPSPVDFREVVPSFQEDVGERGFLLRKLYPPTGASLCPQDPDLPAHYCAACGDPWEGRETSSAVHLFLEACVSGGPSRLRDSRLMGDAYSHPGAGQWSGRHSSGPSRQAEEEARGRCMQMAGKKRGLGRAQLALPEG